MDMSPLQQPETPLSLTKRYSNAIVSLWNLSEGRGPVAGERPDLNKFQAHVYELCQEFALIEAAAKSVDLFSSNEPVDEINVRALPFLNVEFYSGQLYAQLLTDSKSNMDLGDPWAFKLDNLMQARKSYASFLWSLDDHKVLSKDQSSQLESFSSALEPSAAELRAHGSPQNTRQAKIESFKARKSLESRLSVLDEYYAQCDADDDSTDIFERFDEEIVAKIFRDQLSLHSLEAFSHIELLAMEIDVLKNRPPNPSQSPRDPRDSRHKDTSYTTKLETVPVPAHQATVTDLVSPQGKILRPFTITKNREQVKAGVFGTGQVLPSMLVEEYLDYELANGKMAAPAVPDTRHDDSDALDSEEEMEARRWDDWKDDHPKGAGNTKANIG